MNDLKELLQDNLITYLDGMPTDLVDSICQIVIDTIDKEVNQ